ncbi:MAG: decarboxylating 6-phosphogluconate dehydrogenase [Oligoflexia bacterium]|nr:decarboxylating 6-phosphogluconate dehydrogenase [Oligoflexia bacterium]
MKIGLIGLGKMGNNMVLRLLKDKHEVVVYDRSPDPVKTLEKQGAIGASSVLDMLKKLPQQKIIWLMVPSGDPTTQTIKEISVQLSKNDILIDGGNSYYKNSVLMGQELAKKGIHFLDAGTSGGIWGLEKGYCLMVGGAEEIFTQCEPIFKTLAPKDGYLHVGPNGAGHFVKMIHNGIEYGMLEAYGEGFEIMNASNYKLDFEKISHLWNQGSVIRSWLLELTESAFKKNPKLSGVGSYVEDSGEGRWVVAEAMERNVAAPVISLSLFARLRSREKECFSAKLIAALRNEFGGHAIKKED